MRTKPTIEEVEVAYRYPPYLGRSEDKFTQSKDGGPRSPAIHRGRTPRQALHAHLRGDAEVGQGRIDGDVEASTGRFVVKIPVLKDGTFTIQLLNDVGHADPELWLNRIQTA